METRGHVATPSYGYVCTREEEEEEVEEEEKERTGGVKGRGY